MEEKVLKQIEQQAAENQDRIEIQGVHLLRIPEKVKERLEQLPIKSLSFSYCKLNSLTNFPQIQGLRELDLSDNNLKDCDMEMLKPFTQIKYLFLGGNKIQKVESLGFLKDFEKLKEINVEGCPFSEKEGYDIKLFGINKSLAIVDGRNIDGIEVSFSRSDDTEEEQEDQEEDEFIDNDMEGQEEGNEAQIEEESEENAEGEYSFQEECPEEMEPLAQEEVEDQTKNQVPSPIVETISLNKYNEQELKEMKKLPEPLEQKEGQKRVDN